MKFLPLSCLSLLLLSPAMAYAASPVPLGQFGKWSAYALDEENDKACYMVSTPLKAEGAYTKRGTVYAIITHRPAENTRDEFSFMAGYPYKEGSVVKMTIDGMAYNLKGGSNEAAFSADATTDQKIAAAVLKGSKLVVEGASARGTRTKDTFSLSGTGDAYKAISTACNVIK
ncbi:MAG: invasion associated locus B family protein [Pseudobdellovibrionaceae bacterium]